MRVVCSQLPPSDRGKASPAIVACRQAGTRLARSPPILTFVAAPSGVMSNVAEI